MQLVDRYARWLEESVVAEAPPLRVAREIPEIELQTLWMAGEFGREFLTTTGGHARVEHFGAWNREPGPHFTGAEIWFGSSRVRGGVEVHWNASAWDRQAAHSPEYEGTILHVFAREAARERGQAVPATCTALGREVPQIWLDVSRFEFLPVDPPPCAPTACREAFAALPAARAHELVEAAAQYRLCRKAARRARLAEQFGPEEALYQGIAEALGYRNKCVRGAWRSNRCFSPEADSSTPPTWDRWRATPAVICARCGSNGGRSAQSMSDWPSPRGFGICGASAR